MSDRRFSLVVSILELVFVGGVYVDGWARNHDRVDDSFFTPWHGLLYATYLVVAAVMLARVLKTHRTGTTWRAAVPDGYALSLVGVELFLAAGIGDMVWHTLFSVEEDFCGAGESHPPHARFERSPDGYRTLSRRNKRTGSRLEGRCAGGAHLSRAHVVRHLHDAVHQSLLRVDAAPLAALGPERRRIGEVLRLLAS